MADKTTGERTDGAGVGPESETKRLGFALVLISAAQLLVVFDATILNVALPLVQKYLDVSVGNLQWVVTGHALSFGGLLLLGGLLGDLHARRRIFTDGVTIFAVPSALGGGAQNEASP